MHFWPYALIADMNRIKYNLKAFEISGHYKNSTGFRRILIYPDISRHLGNRLWQTDCSGALGMLKLKFTGKIRKSNNRDFRNEGRDCHMHNKSFKVLSRIVFVIIREENGNE